MDLPMGEARDLFVQAECAGNPALRAEAESLLRAHDQAGDFLALQTRKPGTGAGANLNIAPSGAAILNAADKNMVQDQDTLPKPNPPQMDLFADF